MWLTYLPSLCAYFASRAAARAVSRSIGYVSAHCPPRLVGPSVANQRAVRNQGRDLIMDLLVFYGFYAFDIGTLDTLDTLDHCFA